MLGCGVDSDGSGQRPVAGCCECGDEPLGCKVTDLVVNDNFCNIFFNPETLNFRNILCTLWTADWPDAMFMTAQNNRT
jgi:hypothetical protein